jgi:prepilin-type processing-associated H-X9-DG protein
VVIAIIAILAALLLPTLAKAKVQAQGTQCMNNTRQLTLGWLMYVDEFKGLIPNNTPFDPPGVWVLGWLQDAPNVADNTNTTYLVQSLIAPDISKSIPAWHCPADSYLAKEGPASYPRARSISMNGWLNCSAPFPPDEPGVKMIYKLSDMTMPPPASTFVLLDERWDSINDGFFAIDMLNTGAADQIWDWPAFYHNGAAGFSFADGHSEIHKWVDPRTTPRIGTQQLSSTPSPNNPDIEWLQSHSTSVLLPGRTF